MAHSVEARVPFLDHRLVEFSYNLPDDFLEKDGITKRIMREAMAGLIPDKIKDRKDKMGFITPEEWWVKNENPDFFRKKIENAIVVTNGIIKPEALKYFDNLVSEKIQFDYTYWRIILFCEWINLFNVSI
jgi:asparagine synthase (glutamine-hydrolysing)